MPRPTPTTPKGYTRLLHEYNNLNEEYSTLTQQLQENVKSYQEQISENAGIMNAMQETINNLRSQLTDGSASGRISTQVGASLEIIRQTTRRNIFILKYTTTVTRNKDNIFDSMFLLHEDEIKSKR
jgi:predicted RNase H-like nuclease (RuvC/YqgF family)